MSNLTILSGVSGSGKSTWARSQFSVVVVSRDDLRQAYFGSCDQDYYKASKDTLKRREDFITKAEHAAIKSALLSGLDVVSDNTNTKLKYVNAIARIGWSVGANVTRHVVDVPLEQALAQNAFRASQGGRNVPNEVIERQFKELQQSKNKALVPPPPVIHYYGTPGKPKAFLVDIDGTLAHMRDLRGPFDWKNVGVDEVDEVISDIVYRLRFGSLGNDDYDMTCIIMSGRDASCRAETENWLDKHDIYWDELFMRPENDMRADNIIKHELFNKYVRDNYDVQFVLDDRQQVVDMWRSMGLTCLQVAPGDF